MLSLWEPVRRCWPPALLFTHPSIHTLQVEHELLSQYEAQLLAKEHSGAVALLRDDKTEDLGRMHRLFSRVPKGLDPIADIFKEHVDGEVRVCDCCCVQEVQGRAAGKGCETPPLRTSRHI